MGREGVTAQHRQGVRGARADDRDPGVRGQRQQSVRVVQQHHRLLGQAPGQGAARGGVEVDALGRFRVPVLVQQAQFALLEQHATGRPVHQFRGDLARPDRVRQGLAVALQGGQFHVDAGRQRRVRRLGVGARHPVQRPEEADAEVVRDDRAGEPPLLPQEFGQQPGIRRGGHAVGLGVRGHHTARPALAQRHLERRQRDIGELAHPGPHGREIAGARGGGVPGEVLERGDHPGGLQAPHIGGADGAGQIRVLADGLLHPPPARIAYDVQDGREPLVDADRAQVRADPVGHLLDERRVEARSPGQRHRIGGGPPGGEPGQALLVGDGGDAEASGRRDPALGAGEGLRAECGVHGGGAEGAGELAQAVRDQLVPVIVGGHLALQRGDSVAVRGGAHPHAVQLGGLLLKGHPGEQVVDAGGGGQCGVAPGGGGHETPVGADGLSRMFRYSPRMFREPRGGEKGSSRGGAGIRSPP